MAASTVTVSGRPLLASRKHFAVVLLILLAIAGWGLYAQRLRPPRLPRVGNSPATRGTPPNTMYRLYAANIATEWLLLLYVWAGVRRYGNRMSDLTGGRWKDWKAVAIDIVLTIPFWFVWAWSARLIWSWLGPTRAAGPFAFPPHGALDIGLWLTLSATAGFCEEIVYRGYLQKQLHAFTGSAVLALVAQALIFGAGHVYKGYKPVLVIAILGLEYGLLAHFRLNLRPGILSHAWSDMFDGYFKHFWQIRL